MTHSAATPVRTSPLARRYARAIFDLGLEHKAESEISAGVGTLKALLSESADLRRMIASPRIDRAAQGKGMMALGEKAGLPKLLINFLGVMARNGRLSALPEILQAYAAAKASHEQESTAYVTVAQALSPQQHSTLEQSLAGALGGRVKIDVTINPEILGGMIVQCGSRRLDSSIKGRIERLQQQMREVA